MLYFKKMKLYAYLESILDYTENPNPDIQNFIRRRLTRADDILKKVRFIEFHGVLVQKIKPFFIYFNRLSRMIRNLKINNAVKYSDLLDAHLKNLNNNINEYLSNSLDENMEKDLSSENISTAKEILFNIIYIFFILKSFFRKNSDLSLISNNFNLEEINNRLADFFDDDHILIKQIFPNIEKYVFNFPKIKANVPSRIFNVIKKDNKQSDENKKIIANKQFYFFHCLNYDNNSDIDDLTKLEYSTVEITTVYDDYQNKGNITYFDFYIQEGKESGKYNVTDTAFIFPHILNKLNKEKDKEKILNVLYKINKNQNKIKKIELSGKTIKINNMSKILQNKVKFTIPIGFKLGNIIIS